VLASGLIALLMAAPVRGSDPETVAPSEVEVGAVYYVETNPVPGGFGLERLRTYEGVVLESNADVLVIEGNQGSAQRCTKLWLTRLPIVSRFYKSIGLMEQKPAAQFRVAVDEIESIRLVQPRKTSQKTVFAENR
jgi:hypothetical protein